MTPGETLREYRTKARMTQRALGELVGVTHGAAALWERGRSCPTRARAEHLDEVLGAGGAILAAFGYQRPERFVTHAEHTALLERVDELERLVAELRSINQQGEPEICEQ